MDGAGSWDALEWTKIEVLFLFKFRFYLVLLMLPLFTFYFYICSELKLFLNVVLIACFEVRLCWRDGVFAGIRGSNS